MLPPQSYRGALSRVAGCPSLCVKLAPNGEIFSDWLRARITEYLGKKPKVKMLAPGVPTPRKNRGA